MTKQCILAPNDGSAFCRHIYPHLLKCFPPDQTKLLLLRVGDAPVGHTALPPRPAGYDSAVTMYASDRDASSALHPWYASQDCDSATAETRTELTRDILLSQLSANQAGLDVIL